MVFSSITFLVYFMPVFFLVYYIIPGRLKNSWILISSLAFFSWGAPVFIFALVASCFADFVLASRFSSANKKLYFTIAIVINLVLLGYFKYANFFIDNYNELARALTGTEILIRHILLPVGISFLTFHKISFLTDVYRGECEYPKKFSSYLIYVLLFPHLIAGPIVRFKEILPQVTGRVLSMQWERVYYGLLQFTIGLGKKILIANTLGRFVDESLNGGNIDLTFTSGWIIMFAYSFQLYYDFAGYSDMAIGLARMLGFKFPENFNFPYTSKSITEFWKRWHITLGSWMRDYLYIPLGGNRKGNIRTLFNLFIVFFLSGLWHGASWNFVIWGMFHGLFLIMERGLTDTILKKIPSLLAIFLTYIITVTGWVFFRIESFGDAAKMLSAMYSFRITDFEYLCNLDLKFVTVLAIAAFFAFQPNSWQSWLAALYKKPNKNRVVNISMGVILVILYVLCLGELFATGFNPFIYFKF